jgi:hypothetical protein
MLSPVPKVPKPLPMTEDFVAQLYATLWHEGTIPGRLES